MGVMWQKPFDPPNLKYLQSDPFQEKKKKKKFADPYSRLWSAKKKKKENIKVDR